MKTAVIILGHGSRAEGADAAMAQVVAAVKKAGSFEIVEHAFLQYVQPGPDQALERCIAQQAKRIVIVPYFLQPGAHVTRDIPEFVDRARKRYADIPIEVTGFVGNHPLMAQIVSDLVEKQV